MMKIHDYDNATILYYNGHNNGSLYDFDEYTIDEAGNEIENGERRLTRMEIKQYADGKSVMRMIDGLDSAIADFLAAEVEKGQSAYEMVQDGYDGDVDAYIEDYADDYELIVEKGEAYINRIGYDEKHVVTGNGFELVR